MEHIFQIGINVDDDAIVAGVKANAEKEVIKLITAKVEECIYQKSGGYYSRIDKKDLTPLRNIIEKKVDAVLTENKDYILSTASKILADRLARSKAGKAILENLD